MKNNIQFCDLSLPADSETLIWQKAKNVVCLEDIANFADDHPKWLSMTK